jgi:hypothetical protein
LDSVLNEGTNSLGGAITRNDFTGVIQLASKNKFIGCESAAMALKRSWNNLIFFGVLSEYQLELSGGSITHLSTFTEVAF